MKYKIQLLGLLIILIAQNSISQSKIHSFYQKDSKLYSSIIFTDNFEKDSMNIVAKNNDSYFHYFRIGFMAREGKKIFSLGAINGIKFGNFFIVGIGLELNKYKEFQLLPIFIDFRVNNLFTKISPILFGDIGYSLTVSKPFTNQNVDGIFSNIGLGIEVEVSDALAMNIELSWKHQFSKYKIRLARYYSNWEYDNFYKYADFEYNFFTFMLGFSF